MTYLIWSHEHRAWWAPDGAGYARQLSEAGHYSRAEALRICARAIPGGRRLQALPELPVRLDDVTEMVRQYEADFGQSWEPWR